MSETQVGPGKEPGNEELCPKEPTVEQPEERLPEKGPKVEMDSINKILGQLPDVAKYLGGPATFLLGMFSVAVFGLSLRAAEWPISILGVFFVIVFVVLTMIGKGQK